MGNKTSGMGTTQEIRQLGHAYKQGKHFRKNSADVIRNSDAIRGTSRYIKYYRRGYNQHDTPRTINKKSDTPDAQQSTSQAALKGATKTEKTGCPRSRIQEYVACVSGRPCRQDQTRLHYLGRRIAQIRNYIYTEKGKYTRGRYVLKGSINIIQA